MKVLIYSINFSPELTGIGKYNGELASCLVDSGIDTAVITAQPYYPEWRRHKGFGNWWSKALSLEGVNILRAPLYVPRQVTTLKRLVHLASFSLSSLVSLLSLLRYRPDYVLLVQPTLFCAPAALLFCRLTGAKAIMHVQDFEVEAMFALRMSAEELFSRLARGVDRWLTRRFDFVSSISYKMLENARHKGVSKEKLIFFPNWADTSFVTPEISGDQIRHNWGYEKTDKIALYSGNIGRKQGLEIVLEAASYFISRPEVKFIVIGDGAYSETLSTLAVDMGLTNIVFKPLQSWSLMPQVLSMADVHLVTQRHGAADLVLPSKLTNILSAGGHALVTACEDTELGIIADRFPGVYTCVEPENTENFISSLEKLMASNTRMPNAIARNYALEHLNKERIIGRFVGELKKQLDN